MKKEDLDQAFLTAIENMQRIIRDTILDGTCANTGPTVMMVMRKVPNFAGTPLAFLPIGDIAPSEEKGEGKPKVALFSPITLTPPGYPAMPKDIFWTLLKVIGLASNAYGMVIGMEAWLAEGSGNEELPTSLENYPGRKEVGLITTELEGQRGMFSADITRAEDGTVTLGPWVDVTEGKEDMKLEGNPFRAIPANVHN